MKATLKLENGKEVAVEITEEQLKEIEKTKKKTGYDKHGESHFYYWVDGTGDVSAVIDNQSEFDCTRYEIANYYSNKTVAENNARADALMRKLRRYAVEHREHELDWNNEHQLKWYFFWKANESVFSISVYTVTKDFGGIYFDSEEATKTAIEEFKDELIWYFTEYKDSL